jgi:hypothetical protein
MKSSSRLTGGTQSAQSFTDDVSLRSFTWTRNELVTTLPVEW